MQLTDDFKVVLTYYRQRAKGFLRSISKNKDDERGEVCAHCSRFRADEEHVIFITAPPGYGSIMRCSDATAPHGVPMTGEQATELRRSQVSSGSFGG